MCTLVFTISTLSSVPQLFYVTRYEKIVLNTNQTVLTLYTMNRSFFGETNFIFPSLSNVGSVASVKGIAYSCGEENYRAVHIEPSVMMDASCLPLNENVVAL